MEIGSGAVVSRSKKIHEEAFALILKRNDGDTIALRPHQI